MSNIGYVSLSQATALERSMNMTAHNLANATTSGYKAINPLLESVESNSIDEGISYVVDKGTYLDLSNGPLTPTGNPLDVAVSGPGWLSFQLEGGGTGYSRHGQLVVDADGQLKTSTGLALLDGGGGPVTLPEDIGQNVVITTDGAITDPDGVVLGTIGVFNIEQEARMTPLGGGMYQLPGDAAAPQESEDPKIKQGFVEGSNVQAVMEMTRLIDIQRAYENSVRLMTADDTLTKTSIQRLGRV
ncbi:flagellar hook basal-body protein [Sulfitobacter sp. M57]|uniref:flagellar hook basal-body protein n=1 Tax=unclassified Sulfitobacter TaxID=196795 RepID=UPI0023E0FAE0|nr:MULTISPECIES: flagellar hook basal-body protein [unclassified Sulfitobacter]MDF3414809.1 flagellar hook basal-body protein [Sulfitobacter sp. KE5]MDF3422290.1 flagellar hook basal-body protein [Sulfitobacter sp. KE43]MDF3433355.1 flagellar hook basal-body protein [Sulfitobacter sp. KE42]MDF3458995.1 flagellar hook basal-body protein [Sulfitobacter sp. S74]MDF3462894.1 flagellar hook basal-body protein [Sulfitobacter sp. Ks18]